ncbi:hypothetical protein A8C32_02290 [Flavivirga aquatica]|uniref:Uncharacterized protein n=1 Tax=Flavivirga aquatica TaxID=1849968 RepID=A0A1E5TA94_9FLAO|nr:hypothetical protein [Flavivirga aquatica]OEK08302.1 hypothetical protein A8C32_02290 [Flavivirga aquatica]
MTYFIYLNLFEIFIFSLTSFAYRFNTNGMVLNFKPIKNTMIKPLIFDNFNYMEGAFMPRKTNNFNRHKEKIKLEDIEIILKLKKYNEQLIWSLKTLEYISFIEVNSVTKDNLDQLFEILNLKTNIQRDVIEITKKVSYYKSFQNKIRRT